MRGRRPTPVGEEGFAIVIAIVVIFIGFVIGSAALAETLSSRSHGFHDTRGERALQAADAGVQAALYHANELNLANLDFDTGGTAVSSLPDCLLPNYSTSGVLQSSLVSASASVTTGACQPFSGNPPSPDPSPFNAGTPVGDHAYYAAYFFPGVTAVGGHRILSPKIVSIGWDDGGDSSSSSRYVYRRVEAQLGTVNPFEAIEAQGNLTFAGANLLSVPYSTFTVNGNLAVNNQLSVSPQAVAFNVTNALNGALAGSITYGTKQVNALSAIGNYVQQSGTVSRAAISVSATKPSCPAGSGSNCGLSYTSVPTGQGYVASDDTFYLNSSSASVQLPGGDYVFCNFDVESGSISANPTATTPVRIYIDSPSSSRCQGKGISPSTVAKPGSFVASTGVTNLLSQATGVTGASALQIYVVGDGGGNDDNTLVTIATGSGSNLAGAVAQSMFLYAPTSLLNLTGTVFQGSFIGNDITFHGGGGLLGAGLTTAITEDTALADYSLSSALGVFHTSQYIECSPLAPPADPTVSDPSAGC